MDWRAHRALMASRSRALACTYVYVTCTPHASAGYLPIGLTHAWARLFLGPKTQISQSLLILVWEPGELIVKFITYIVPFCFTMVLYIAGLLTKYFNSWRPYKLILQRLREVHGIERRYTMIKNNKTLYLLLLSLSHAVYVGLNVNSKDSACIGDPHRVIIPLMV